MVLHSCVSEWEADKVDEQRNVRINIIVYNLAELMKHNFRMKRRYRGSVMGMKRRIEGRQ